MLQSYLVLVFAALIPTVVFIELFYKSGLGKVIKQAMTYAQKSLAVLGSKKISDHWKEKVLLVYAGRMIRYLLTGAVIFFLILAVVLFLLFLEHRLFNIDSAFSEWLVSIKMLLVFCVIGVGYTYLRNRLYGSVFKGR